MKSLRRNRANTESVVVPTVVRRIPVAIRRTQVVTEVEPRAATQNAPRPSFFFKV